MKKLIAALAVAALLVSCATQTDITEKNEDGSPIWTTEVPQSTKYVYGVGSAKLSNAENSAEAADAKARADMSRKLQVMMSDAVAVYSQDSEGYVLDAYESITVQTVSISIRGIKTEQRWTAPDGTVWSLVSVPTKDLDDIYGLEANNFKNKLEKDKLALEQQYYNALEDIAAAELAEMEADKAEAEKEAALADLAVQKAAVENHYATESGKYDAQSAAVDPDGLAQAMRDAFVAAGYDLD